MVKAAFVNDFDDVCEFFGISRADEHEQFKVLCRGNMDAAERFMATLMARVRTDPRYGINDRIRERIKTDKETRAAAEKQKSLDKQVAEE